MTGTSSESPGATVRAPGSVKEKSAASLPPGVQLLMCSGARPALRITASTVLLLSMSTQPKSTTGSVLITGVMPLPFTGTRYIGSTGSLQSTSSQLVKSPSRSGANVTCTESVFPAAKKNVDSSVTWNIVESPPLMRSVLTSTGCVPRFVSRR